MEGLSSVTRDPIILFSLGYSVCSKSWLRYFRNRTEEGQRKDEMGGGLKK